MGKLLALLCLFTPSGTLPCPTPRLSAPSMSDWDLYIISTTDAESVSPADWEAMPVPKCGK